MRFKSIFWICCLLFSINFVFGQDYDLKLLNQQNLDAEMFYGADLFGNLYYSNNNVLYKQEEFKIYQYHNLALGDITSVSIYNPLKIVVFYKDFNTVIILDKTLNEIEKVEFLNKNISLVAKAGKNKIWLYDADKQQLELFDYVNKETISNSQPYGIASAISLKGTANTAWIHTDLNTLLVYNNYGSLINTYHQNFDDYFILPRDKVLFRAKNKFYFSDNQSLFLSLKDSFKTAKLKYGNNQIYLFKNKQLFTFQLLKK